MRISSTIAIILLLATALGCQKPTDEFVNETNLTDEAVKELRTTMLLAEEPANTNTVIEVRDQVASKDQAEAAAVVVIGVVGGMPNPFQGDGTGEFPWFEKMSAFSLVDPTTAEQFAGEHNHADGEECIWCMRTAQKLSDTVATVVLNDSTGTIVPERADRLLLLKEGSTVVVRGTGRVELGVLKIAADGVYVQPE